MPNQIDVARIVHHDPRTDSLIQNSNPFKSAPVIHAPPADVPKFSMTGPLWVVSLTHQQTESLDDTLKALNGVINEVLPYLEPTVVPALIIEAVVAAIEAASEYISWMDAIGGNQGVDIQGVIGVNGVLVTPHVSGWLKPLEDAARSGVAVAGVATILEFLLKASGQDAALASILGVGTASQVFAAVTSGTPLGIALAAALGVAIDLLLPLQTRTNTEEYTLTERK